MSEHLKTAKFKKKIQKKEERYFKEIPFKAVLFYEERREGKCVRELKDEGMKCEERGQGRSRGTQGESGGEILLGVSGDSVRGFDATRGPLDMYAHG